MNKIYDDEVRSWKKFASLESIGSPDNDVHPRVNTEQSFKSHPEPGEGKKFSATLNNQGISPYPMVSSFFKNLGKPGFIRECKFTGKIRESVPETGDPFH